MFDPKALGFTEVANGFGTGGSKMQGMCYLHIGRRRKTREVHDLRVMLDDVTTSIARGMFGERCGVAIDDRARIVLYKGSSRKIMQGKSLDRGMISVDAERRKLLAILGTSFTNYEYEAKMWAKGEAILLTPKGAIQ